MTGLNARVARDGMPDIAPTRFHFSSTIESPLQRLRAFYMSGRRHRASRRAMRTTATGDRGRPATADARLAPGSRW